MTSSHRPSSEQAARGPDAVGSTHVWVWWAEPREQGGWGPVGGLLFLALWSSEQNMQKVRAKKVQKERERKLPFAEQLLNEFQLSSQPPRETGGRRISPFHQTQN